MADPPVRPGTTSQRARTSSKCRKATRCRSRFSRTAARSRFQSPDSSSSISLCVMGLLIRDAQSAVRLLRVQPGFSVVAVLTLAVGIGLSTTLFTVIHAAVLRPFPISDPERLVRIDVRFPQPDGEPIRTTPSLQDVRDWRAATALFSNIAMDCDNRSQVVDAGEPERLPVRWVSEDYFELFDIKPIIGRS